MNTKPTRAEMIRVLQLAAAGKLKPESLKTGFKVVLDLDAVWTRPDGTPITIKEKEHEAKRRGARFVTLDLS